MRTQTLIGLVTALVLAVSCTHTKKTADKKTPQAKREWVTVYYQADRGGQFEPCGCSLNPSGGIVREKNEIDWAKRDNPGKVLYLDAGRMLISQKAAQITDKKSISNSRKRAQAFFSMVEQTQLDVFAPSLSEMVLSKAEIKKYEAKAKFPFVSANLRDASSGELLFKDYVIVERGGIRFAVFGIAAPNQAMEKKLGVEVEKPITAVQRILLTTRGQADYVVMLSQLKLEAAEKLIADSNFGIHLAVNADSSARLDSPQWLGGRSLIAEPHVEGFTLGKLEILPKFPFKGFTSIEEILSNKALISDLKKKSGKEELFGHLDSTLQTRPIPNASLYRNKILKLQESTHGKQNSLVPAVAKAKKNLPALPKGKTSVKTAD